jgi:hypothetical protein
LSKIEGVSEIETDIAGRTCTFKISDPSELESQLAEFAETNSHLEGFTIE